MQAFPEGIARAWSLPVLPTAAILLTGGLYLRGWTAARRTRPQHLSIWCLASFLGGLLTLWLAIASPLDALDDYLLTAHMLQHFLLMSIVPPLLVLGAPQVPLLRGIPISFVRTTLSPIFRRRWFHLLGCLLAHPMFAWLTMNLSFLLWHLPPAYELTLHSEPWHNVEHLCFLLTSVLFWWNVLSPWPHRRRWPLWTMIPYLFTADLINTILSAILCFSGRIFYSSYGLAERITGLSALQDQVAAGAEMWILNSIVFLIPAMILTIKALNPRYLQQQSPIMQSGAQ